MTDKYTKICSTSYVIREIKVKIPMRYQQAPIRMTKVQTLTAQNGRGDIEQQELSFTDSENAYCRVILEYRHTLNI